MTDATRSYDLATFGLSDMVACGAGLRAAVEGATSFDTAAERLVRFLRERFVDETGAPACALVRCFHTVPFAALDAGDRRFVEARVAPDQLSDRLTCLRLAATAGDEPAWNDRERSVAHRALPLASTEVVEASPMIAALLRQFGVDLGEVVEPARDLVLGRHRGAFDVFHVERAAGSPHVPAQDGFVDVAGIQSVLGFGAMLPTGELFAVIVFSRVPISPAVASRFATVALNAKVALLPSLPGWSSTEARERVAEARAQAFEDLLSVQQEVVADQGRALEESSRRLRRLTEASVAVNEVTGLEAIVDRLTVAAAHTLGARRATTTLAGEDVHGRTLSSVWPPRSPEEAERPGQAEEAVLTVPLVGRDGAELGTIALSARLEGGYTPEDEATLVQLAHIASLAIENAQLAGQEALQEAARFREELLAGITHDMKTPLAAVVGLAETLGDERLRPDEREDAQQALLRQARSLRRLVLQFLDYTRMEAGYGVDLATEPVVVAEALEDAVRLFGHLREVELVVPDGLPEVWADPVRLEQVVSNLLSNAVKFSPPGSPVAVRAERHGDEVEVVVEDRGSGLEPSEVLNLFQRFYRGGNTARLPGSGLGLYVSKRLVEGMGGTIRVSSQPGRGTRFTVSLPAVAPDGASSPPDRQQGERV